MSDNDAIANPVNIAKLLNGYVFLIMLANFAIKYIMRP